MRARIDDVSSGALRAPRESSAGMQKNALFFVGAYLSDTRFVDAGYSNAAGIYYRQREKNTNTRG
jgi:hypothetical protein